MLLKNVLAQQGTLFLILRLILTGYRKSVTPYTFNCIMMLKLNPDLWSTKTIADILR
jgi:hypothetical protein